MRMLGPHAPCESTKTTMPRTRTKSREARTGDDATTTSPAEHVCCATLEAGPLERFFVAFVSGEGVVAAGFAQHANEFASFEPAAAPTYLDALRRYFDGEDVSLDAIPVALRGTPFQRRVWEALRTIPRGKVVSYAHIAKRIGVPRGMRAVGLANGKNPIPVIVPCHRVVEANGTLGGFSGGLENKRKLLALEGVSVVQDRVLAGQGSLFPG